MVAVGVADVRPIVDRVCARPDVLDACRERNLGYVIKALWENGLSQGKMGALTGKPQGRISEWMTGKRAPQHASVIDEIATGLGFPPAARRALGLTAEPDITVLDRSSSSQQLDADLSFPGTAAELSDQSEVMLQGLRDRASQRAIVPAQPAASIHGPHIVALAGQDRDSRTVSLILDESTANLAIFAIAAHAEEREAHVREVQRYGRHCPKAPTAGTTARPSLPEKRVAARLRAVEQAYRTALERGAAPAPPGLTATSRSPERPAGKEIELE